METFEDLNAAIGTVSFDSDALIERAVAEGRRRQRRRRTAVGVGALALGALMVVPIDHHSSGSTTADDTGWAGRTTTSHDRQNAGVRTPPTGTDGRVAVPTAELTDARLVQRLPVAGDLVSATGGQWRVSVQRTIDPDGSGAGSVTLDLNAEQPLSREQVAGADQKCALIGHSVRTEWCTALSDGWMFGYRSHPDVQDASPQALDWGATVVGKDGTSVSLHATNYVDAAHPDRQLPVLDVDQVERLASDPVWFQPAQ